MDQTTTCAACRSENPATAAFCNRCGAALAPATPVAEATTGAPSGWALATAGMDRAPDPVVAGAGPLRTEECAGWWQRLGGSLLDWLLLHLLAGALIGGYFLVWWMQDPFGLELAWWNFEHVEDDYGVGVFWVPLLGYLLVRILWEAGWTSSRHMAKPGQWMSGFRVVRVDDVQPIGRGRASGRVLSKLALNAVIGFIYHLVSAFTIGLGTRKQGLHDMIAGTACVQRRALRVREVGPDAGDDSLLPIGQSTTWSTTPRPSHAGRAPEHAPAVPPPPPPLPSDRQPGSGSSGPFV